MDLAAGRGPARPRRRPTTVTADQLRALVGRLAQAGQWRPGDPPILFVLDAGYDVVRLSWLLGELPVRLLGRLRADRVLYGVAGRRRGDHPGRPPRHGAVLRLADPATHPLPVQTSSSLHDRFGKVVARCWGACTQAGTARILGSASRPATDRGGHPGPPRVEHLPGDRDPKPLWLWYSHPDAAAVDVDRLWRLCLRRFDLEHTFRFCKQTLGLTRPRLRRPVQADRWAWLVLAAYTQLRLARGLAADLRRPWERPVPPEQLSRAASGGAIAASAGSWARRPARRNLAGLAPAGQGPSFRPGAAASVGKQQHEPATSQPSQTTETG